MIKPYINNETMKPERKDIEGYARMRSSNGNMLEKALAGQTGQCFKVTTLCSQPLTKKEQELLEYCLHQMAMTSKYITNDNICELVSIACKLGLSNARDIELCKE